MMVHNLERDTQQLFNILGTSTSGRNTAELKIGNMTEISFCVEYLIQRPTQLTFLDLSNLEFVIPANAVALAQLDADQRNLSNFGKIVKLPKQKFLQESG